MSGVENTPTVVTTSWDDGDALDLQLATMLANAGLAGTFYVPIRGHFGSVMSPAKLRELHALGMEVGGHTVNHVDVTRLSAHALRRELSESKDQLEQIVQEPVSSFCYPMGAFSAETARAVAACGYDLGRTTVAFRTGVRFDPYRMPVTMQLFPHTRSVHARHALKERNVGGLTAWLTQFGAATSLSALAARAFDRVRSRGGVFHVWGHSWELAEHNLWDDARSIFEALAGHDGVEYLTNGEVGQRLARSGTAAA